MKPSRSFVIVLCLAMATPFPTRAGVRSEPVRANAADVALAAGGLLTGRVVTDGLADVEVVIRHQGRDVARTRVAADGTFAVRGLRGGLHHVVVGRQVRACRFWTARTAPPSATRGLVLHADKTIVRAQNWGGPPGAWGAPMGPDPGLVMGTALVLGAGVIGGVIGYNVKDCKKCASP